MTKRNRNDHGSLAGVSKVIGVISEDMSAFNTPEIIEGIGARCDANDYCFILANLQLERHGINPQTDAKAFESVLEKEVYALLGMQVDGIIYVSGHSHTLTQASDSRSFFSGRPVPFVCAYCFSGDRLVPSVLYDDRKAACEVVELFIKAGHSRIAFITGPANSVHSVNRLNGAEDALSQHGMRLEPELTAHGDWGRKSGYCAVESLLNAVATAIFACNDLMALGVIDRCAQLGIQVGRELALFGFDNREVSLVCQPRLSTVHIPLFEIGEKSADLLFERINGEEDIANEVLHIECMVIERESSRFGI